MKALILFLSLCTATVFAFAIVATVKEIERTREVLWFLTGVFLVASLWICHIVTTPSAIDVYRNKTELEYRIRGNEIVDSTVVFRKED